MQFVLPTPPLQHVAGVKIVAHLWNQRDLSDHFLQMEKVKSKISTLPLPKPSKKQLVDLIRPLGIEDLTWSRYHDLDGTSFASLNILFPHQMCWTMHGTIDYKKTAELMMKDESLDVERRYKFACINCLEDEAAALFARLDAEGRREYVSKMRRNMRNLNHQQLLAFFTFTITGEAHRMNSFFPPTHPRGTSVNRVLFDGALENGGAAMCEYWFKKLSQREKERVFEESASRMRAGRWSDASSLLYYLSLLNEEQRGRLFRECTLSLLLCLLRSPTQALFVEAARRGWQLLDEEECARALDNITERIRDGFRDYSQLFWECWRLTSAEYKRHFLNDVFRLELLLVIEDEEFHQLVFKHASSQQLRELVANRRYGIMFLGERTNSEAASIECKQTAAFNSENDEEEDEEKRLRSGLVSQLVLVMAKRRAKRKM